MVLRFHHRRISIWIAIVLFSHVCTTTGSPASTSSSSGMVLRIRLADGSMEKVLVPQGAEETMTLSDILKPFDIEDGSSIQVDKQNNHIKDTSTNLSGLGVKHGSMITIQPSTIHPKPTESRFSQQLKVDASRASWDPYPDLAKDYEHALLKTKTRRSSQKGMSYGAIAQLQSSLHVLEPQPEGPLKRLYMCQHSAERFQVNGINNKKQSILCRVGLLLGTIQTERVEFKAKKARTSLSSQTSDSEYCQVAKVQAVWEPPGQKTTDHYDESLGRKLLHENPRVLPIAEQLGLVPVGWIFSYQDARRQYDDALPVYGVDVQTGATLQIANMRRRHSDNDKESADGAKFVTLAMDAHTGATEAFQLSDVSVQMVHEGLLSVAGGGGDENQKSHRRLVPTKHAVLVDGKETTELDSVLCLVNTAMLSHEGSYAGKTATSSVKKNTGGLTNKTKKNLLRAMDEGDHQLLEELCDLNTLLALDQTLAEEDTKALCQLVRKWARGQKQGTEVGSKLKMHLRSVLET